ncbi:MAG: FkbM family methyltransferase [Alphaproteobacteria bacterium]|nr:FkbM family methyltransferase [Alphaproteobacteria bacterium]
MFLDIGAYFGLYALLMDRSMLFDRVVAFEPDERNARQLAANLFLNAGSRIEVRHEAVSDRSGRTWFTQSESHPTGNRAGISMADGPGSTRREVPMVAIDDAFDFEGWTIIAKIDVEGEEHAVLHGMRRTLARNRAVLQVEAFEHNLVSIRAARDELGLRTVGEIYPDVYLTNIPEPI